MAILFVCLLLFVFMIIGIILCIDSYATVKENRVKQLTKFMESSDSICKKLSEEQLNILQKIYKKPFKDGTVYQVEGLLYYGYASSHGRSYDTCIKGMQIKSRFMPYSTSTLEDLSAEYKDGKFNPSAISSAKNMPEVVVEAVVYKGLLYAIKVDDFDIISELTPIFSLKKSIGITDGCLIYSFLLFLFAVSVFVYACSLPDTTSIIVLLLMMLSSISFSVYAIYRINRAYIVSGVYQFRENLFYEDNPYIYEFGMIGNVLIKTDKSLEIGKQYTVLAKEDSTVALDIDKINGKSYPVNDIANVGFLCVFCILQFAMACVYFKGVIFDCSDESKSVYEHNLARFGIDELGQYIDPENPLYDLYIGDNIGFKNVFFDRKSEQFVLLDPELKKLLLNSYWVQESFFDECSKGNLFEWVKGFRSQIKADNIKFEFDKRFSTGIYQRPLSNYMDCKMNKEVLRYILCPDCAYVEDPVYGVVTDIDYQNLTVKLTNKYDLEVFPYAEPRYYASIIILIGSFFYLLIGFIPMLARRYIERKNRYSDIIWA